MKSAAISLIGALLVLPAAAWATGPGGGNGGGHAGPRGAGFQQMLEQFDADGDGGLSAAEFTNARTARHQAADADGDGLVTLKELQEMVSERMIERVSERFGTVDANGDGGISAGESALAGNERFTRMDRDGDGVLTSADRRR